MRQYVRGRKRAWGWAIGEVFVPQVHAPGMEAEVDWGEAEVVLAGVATRCIVELAELVDAKSLVTIRQNRYSVPVALAGLKVSARIGAREITVNHGGREVARQRSTSCCCGASTGPSRSCWRFVAR